MDAGPARLLPYVSVLRPESKTECLLGYRGFPSPQTQAHSLCACPQQELVLRMLPVEELQEEHMAGDALELET